MSETDSASVENQAPSACAPVATMNCNEEPRPVARPVVLFDGACSLCRREIAHYRRVSGASQVAWVDLSDYGPGQHVHGIPYDDAMAVFHVRDRQGNWHRGAYGFVELWHQLRGYRWLGKVVRTLRLTSPLDRAYRHFARWRSRGNCDGASCAAPSSLNGTTGSTRTHTGNPRPLGDSRCE